MIIRKAKEDDVRQISEIVVEDWKTAYKGIIDSNYLDSMSTENQYQIEINRFPEYVVAAKGEEILGYVWKRMIDDEASDCEIIALYVRLSKRNCGIGRALLLDSIDSFRKAGRKQMIIWCLKENLEARKFYEKMGGKVYKDGTHKWGDKEYDLISYLYRIGI